MIVGARRSSTAGERREIRAGRQHAHTHSKYSSEPSMEADGSPEKTGQSLTHRDGPGDSAPDPIANWLRDRRSVRGLVECAGAAAWKDVRERR